MLLIAIFYNNEVPLMKSCEVCQLRVANKVIAEVKIYKLWLNLIL